MTRQFSCHWFLAHGRHAKKSFQYLVYERNIECYVIAPTLGAQSSKALTGKHKRAHKKAKSKMESHLKERRHAK